MKTKIAVFDFDGTLTVDRKGSNCWVKVWEVINGLDIDYMLYKMHKNGEITREEWNDRIAQEFNRRNVNIDVCKKVANSLKKINGLTETFKFLNDNNVKIFILSGGIRQIIELVLKDDIKYIEDIECQEFIFDKEGYVCDIPMLEMDIENKAEYLNFLKSKYNIKGEEILFVGNSVNDEEAYKSGAKTVCINPDETDFNNKTIWNHSIEHCNNLSDIIPFLQDKEQIQ